MTKPMYLLVGSKAQAKTVFLSTFPSCDIRKIIGELQTLHITVGSLSKTADGQTILEIPGSLEDAEGWHTKILNSPYANKLLTKEQVQPLMPKELY